MTTFSIQTEQMFSVTYEIDADSPSEAWELLTANTESWYLTCVDQQPSSIIATKEESSIEELPV